MPRKLPRSKEQLKKTSAVRDKVFDFMRRFNARELWTINGPMMTDCDEIMCFSWAGGTVIIQTWQEGHGWSIYTEPTSDGRLDQTETAMLFQMEENKRTPDNPLSAMWVLKIMEGMLPRCGRDALGVIVNECSKRLAQIPLDDGQLRVPVAGMTPDGFEPGPAVEDRLSVADEAHLFATGHLPQDF